MDEVEETTEEHFDPTDFDMSVIVGDEDDGVEASDEGDNTGRQQPSEESSDGDEASDDDNTEGEDGTEGDNALDESELDVDETFGLDDDSGYLEPDVSSQATETPQAKAAREAAEQEEQNSRQQYYEKFLPEDLAIAKDLRNEPFNRVKDILIQRAEAKRQLDEYQAKVRELEEKGGSKPFYTHENGYMLTPEYKQYETAYEQVNNVKAFTDRQLDVPDGEVVKVFNGVDQKGNPQFVEVAMSQSIRNRMQQQSNRFDMELNNITNAAGALEQQHKQAYESGIKQQKEFYNSFVTKLPQALLPAKEQVQKFMERKLPPQLRSLPGQEELAGATLLAANLISAYQKLHKDYQLLKAGKAAVKASGPKPGKLTKTQAKPSNSELDLSIFDVDTSGDEVWM